MSRGRSIIIEGEQVWFDTTKNGERATHDQLELLSTVEREDLDDLLDADFSQGEIVKRLREALGQGKIPEDVLVRRQQYRRARQAQPKCRICKKQGDSTKHHFVNKWILKELANYASRWADRSKNCIPVCIDCHRDLHERNNGSHSIAERLTDTERQFAHEAIRALIHERPRLFELLVLGDDSVYEARLVKDWCEAKFVVKDLPKEAPHRLRAAA